MIWKTFTFLDDPHLLVSAFIKDTACESVTILLFLFFSHMLFLADRESSVQISIVFMYCLLIYLLSFCLLEVPINS